MKKPKKPNKKKGRARANTPPAKPVSQVDRRTAVRPREARANEPRPAAPVPGDSGAPSTSRSEGGDRSAEAPDRPGDPAAERSSGEDRAGEDRAGEDREGRNRPDEDPSDQSRSSDGPGDAGGDRSERAGAAGPGEPGSEAPDPPPPLSSVPRRTPNRRQKHQDTLAWVVVPKLEALLQAADEALAAEPPDRQALIAARSRLEKEWRALLPIPSSEADRLGRAYDERRSAFLAKIGALPDPRVEEEARNLAARQALVAEAVALGAEADLRVAVERAKALQKAWREAPRISKAALAEEGARFKAAIDAIFARRTDERAERVAKLQALVERAEVLVRSADPDKAAEVMKQLQAKWKETGGVRGEDGDALWTRFRAAADQVFERRRTAAAEEELANRQAREALIAQALALAAEGVEDPDETIRQLQGKWRRIGPVPRDQADALWTSFREACTKLRSPPPVDPEALGSGESLRFNPFAALSGRPPEE